MKQTIFGAIIAVMMVSCAGGDKPVATGEYKLTSWPENAKCAISYTFDDGCPNQLTIAMPIFAKYDRCATFYLVKNWVGENWAPWIEAATVGHEIACHTVTHPNLYELTDEVVESELQGCKSMIDSLVSQEHLPTVAYPYCATPKNEKLISDTYIAGRICNNHIEPATPADFVRISSFGVGSESPLNCCDSLVALFEKTESAGGWCTLLFHEIDEGTGYSPFASSELDKSLAYLTSEENEGDYWVAPFAQVARYILRRNATKIEETAVAKDSFTFKVNTLPAVYTDEVLTIERNMPEGWTKCKLQDDKVGTCVVEDGKLIITLSKCEGPITIEKSE